MPTTRSKKEIELNESKLEAEIRKINAEAEYAELELAEAMRDERDALARNAENRVYNFAQVVGADTATKAINTLSEWARRDKDPMTVVFNSPGGGVIPGFALFDALLEHRDEGIHITTVARGYAASMAGILLQAGDERVIGKNSYILIHEVSDLAIGTTSEIEDELKLIKRFQARALKILSARSTMSEKEIEKKWKRQDWWLDADEAIELGFADRIG